MKLYWMKKVVFTFLITLFMPSIVFAHSGGTDAFGGHNSPTGYHYHHGYSAHQHTDGICPYDYDDQTGYSSGSSSYSVQTAYAYSDNDYNDGYDDGYDYGFDKGYAESKKENMTLLVGAFCLPTVVAGALTYRSNSKAHKENRTIFQLQQQKTKLENDIKAAKSTAEIDQRYWEEKIGEYKDKAANAKTEADKQMQPHLLELERKIESLNGTIEFLKEETKRLEDINNDLEKAIIGKSRCITGDLSHLIPKDTIINSDGYPVYLYATDSAFDKYLVVINRNSQVFHHPLCQHAWSKEKINIGKAMETHRPCKFCEHLLPDMKWYYKYKSICKHKEER